MDQLLDLSKGELEDLRRVRGQPGWRVYCRCLEALEQYHLEQIPQGKSKDEIADRSQFYLGMKSVIELPDKILNREENTDVEEGAGYTEGLEPADPGRTGWVGRYTGWGA